MNPAAAAIGTPSPSRPFDGLVAAVHTPFRDGPGGAGGALAVDVVPAQARHLAASGVSAVFVAGTTGEGSSLTLEEKRDLLSAWSPVGSGDVPGADLRVIAHVGGSCLADSIALAEHCAGLAGIEAVGAVAPSYLAPRTPADLALSLQCIIQAAKKPTYYYDIPVLTGIHFSAYELANAFAEHAPGLAGIKCTRFEGSELLDFVRFDGGRFDVLAGRDEALLSALPLGIHGAVGSTYNFAAPLYLALMKAFAAGDLERAATLQWQSVEMIRALAALPFLPACRRIMEHQGVPLGPPRLPLAPLTAAQNEQLDVLIAAAPWVPASA
ncbi:MAG: N-acetylneuraminate lyase [Paracoccaceae bacterium]|jgi:N-acetylneuraminate lyase